MRNAWLLLGLGLLALGQAPRVDVVAREADRRVDVTVDGKPFTSYIWPTTLKKPTLYPLRAASGVVVTRGWPLDPRPGERVDHPHQVGLWFAHGDVNGLDFWNNSDAIPAARADKMGTILQRAVRSAKSGRGEGTLDVTAEWVNSQGKPLLRENTRFVFRAAAGHATTVPMLNNEGVTGRYRSSEGIEGDSVWGTRGRWTMLRGIVQGEPV